MKIIILGETAHLEEGLLKFNGHRLLDFSNRRDAAHACTADDVIFDFTIEQAPTEIAYYSEKRITVFLNTCFIPLSSIVAGRDDLHCACFGFNGMPTFFNREYLEVTLLRQRDAAVLREICLKLSTEFKIVEDQAGMVTSRVVCMIINEAYFALEEGVASRSDIDLAMRLGTNYPYGPFEWAERIGVSRVCRLLEAVHTATGDPRYRLAPLLRNEGSRSTQ